METTEQIIKDLAVENPPQESTPEQSSINPIERIPIEKRNNGWQSGASGNPNGRPANKASITYQIKQLLAAGEGIKAKELAKTAVTLAQAGSFPHLKEVLERTDGKVADKTDHTFNTEGLSDLLLKLRGYKQLPEGKG